MCIKQPEVFFFGIALAIIAVTKIAYAWGKDDRLGDDNR
jgi:hypothetical protein